MRTLKMILSGWQSVSLVVFITLFFNMEVSGKGKVAKNAPVFTQFIYQGEDAVYQNNPFRVSFTILFYRVAIPIRV